MINMNNLKWLVVRVNRPQEHFGGQGVYRFAVAAFLLEADAVAWASASEHETEVVSAEEFE